MPGVRCFQIDAFTDRPFAGNPAAVCLLEEESDGVRQCLFVSFKRFDQVIAEPQRVHNHAHVGG